MNKDQIKEEPCYPISEPIKLSLNPASSSHASIVVWRIVAYFDVYLISE